VFQTALNLYKKDYTFIEIPKNQKEDEFLIIKDNKPLYLKKIDGRSILGKLAEFYLNPIQTAFVEFYRGENTIVSTPTGTGKTITFYYAYLYNKGKAIYVSPTRALANQIYKELKEKTKFKVFLKTGEYDSFIPKNYDIVITTAESFVTSYRNESPWIKESKLIVFDEIHVLLNDLRSIAYEEALIHALNDNKKLLLLSATIPDLDSLAKWVNAKLVIKSDWRPIELKRKFYNIPLPTSKNIHKFVDEIYKKILKEQFEKNYKTILVVPSKKLGWLILEELEKRGFKALNETVPYVRHEGKIRTAFHNADVPKEERELIEELFRDKNSELSLLIATQTLAVGFNSPADDVIIIVRNLRGELFPDILDILQFEGRAGRPGYSKKGYGTVHYIVGKGKKTEELLKEELNKGLNRKLVTILDKSYANLIGNEFLIPEIEREIKFYLEEIKNASKEEKNYIIEKAKFWIDLKESLDNISLLLLGIIGKNINLLKKTHFFTTISKEKEDDFFELNKSILKYLENKSLVKEGKLTLKGELISKFYINPSNYLFFEEFIENYKEKEDDFWLLWNAFPLLFKGNYYLPDFYPEYYLLENFEEIIEINDKLPLMLYSLGYFGEFIDLEIKEENNRLIYKVHKLKPPTWVINLNNDVSWLIDFVNSILKRKLIDLEFSKEDIERIKYSYILGIHPYFVKFGLIKNIGINRAFLLKELAKFLDFKKDDEFFKYLKENKNWKEEFMELWKEIEKSLRTKYENKLKFIVKEKFNVEFISEKIKEALNKLLLNEKKEYLKAIEILERELKYL
jgi:replicative superfamily II helicase